MEKINLNTAKKDELEKIKHIGKKRSEKIINNRPFKDIYELSSVKGLGKKRMDDILKQNIIII